MEVFKYSHSIDVSAPREKLLPRVTNPILFAAITAHILLLKAYSQQANDSSPSVPSHSLRTGSG